MKCWPNGVYALWYPLLTDGLSGAMLHSLGNKVQAEMLVSEIRVRETGMSGMHGSGMLIVNPPWKTDVVLKPIAPWLCRQLTREGAGFFRMFLMDPSNPDISPLR